MLTPNAALASELEAAVRRLEARTHAELVVVLAGRSGQYRDLALLAGGLVGLVGLLAASASPLVFSPVLLPLELAVVALLVAWLVDRSPTLLRWLAPKARQSQQVDEAAAAAFYTEGAHATEDRRGVLVYISALEGQLRVLADSGVPRPTTPTELDSAAALMEALDALGGALAQSYPAREGDFADELPDAPRVRP